MTNEELIQQLSSMPSQANVYFYIDGMYLSVDELAWHTREDIATLNLENSPDEQTNIEFGTAQGVVVLI
jgi:hypothetical protein